MVIKVSGLVMLMLSAYAVYANFKSLSYTTSFHPYSLVYYTEHKHAGAKVFGKLTSPGSFS